MKQLSDLGRLAAFVAVAEECHFRRAAERLHLAQPVLSRQIQQLERDVGVQLLTRTTRQVSLTDAGAVLLDDARRLLHDADMAVGRASRAASGDLGRLTLGFVDSAAFVLLPRLLRRFVAHHPEVVTELRELSTERQLEALHGDVDVAVLREVDAADDLEVQLLLRERLCAALPRDHRLAGEPSLALADLADEEFVLFPRHEVPRVYDHLIALCQQSGFRPAERTHALQYTTLLALVATGYGVSLVPAAVSEVCRRDVVLIALSDDHAISRLSLAWRAGETSPAIQRIVEHANHVAGTLEARSSA
jgi:DNA-binding transcriptional LysR family regulator